MDDRELATRLTNIETTLMEIKQVLTGEIEQQENEEETEQEELQPPEPPTKIRPKKKVTE